MSKVDTLKIKAYDLLVEVNRSMSAAKQGQVELRGLEEKINELEREDAGSGA